MVNKLPHVQRSKASGVGDVPTGRVEHKTAWAWAHPSSLCALYAAVAANAAIWTRDIGRLCHWRYALHPVVECFGPGGIEIWGNGRVKPRAEYGRYWMVHRGQSTSRVGRARKGSALEDSACWRDQ